MSLGVSQQCNFRAAVGQHTFVCLRYTKRYNDLSCFSSLNIYDLFVNCRPDIAVCNQSDIVVLELTVCHETNLETSKNFKIYQYLTKENSTGKASLRTVTLFTCEVSTLCFISEISRFLKACKLPKLPDLTKNAIINSAISNSYSINCNRNDSE